MESKFLQSVPIVDPKNGLPTQTTLQKLNSLLALLDQVTGDVAGITIPLPSTDSQIRASSGTGYVSAASLATASDIVTLTDAATIDVDWSTFINGQVTLSGNHTLGLPTNGKVGEWRTILVGGNDGTSRTLSFASGYQGDLPTLSDISTNKWYMLSIFCWSPTTPSFILKATQAYP